MITAQPYMNPAAGYDHTKFRALAQISEVPLGIAVRTDSPHRDVRALFDAARTNPGKIRYSVPGLGTIQHVTMESFARREGVTLKVIAYKSGVEAVTGVLTGDADFVYVAASNYIGQDKLRVLAVTAAARLPEFPEAPTMAEAGKPLDAAVWFGIFAPAGISEPIAARLEAALAAAIKSPGTQATLEKLKITPAYLDPAAFARRVVQNAESNRAILKELGLAVK
jgi:tripartite-type tricarboxylate transporter receptor subunit TctC